jgi:hypothetical protein
MRDVSKPIDPQRAVDYILKMAPEYAKAKAERVYLEEFRKSKKSLLLQDAPQGTVADREAYAYAHPEYVQLLEALRTAVEAEETARWGLIAAQARVEVWRSTEATNRTQDRSTR